jgi:hypothetical protein
MVDLETQLEPRLLLQKEPPAIAHYFHDLIKSEGADIEAINTHLLSHVHNESIPVIVYEIWFHLAVKQAPELLHRETKSPTASARQLCAPYDASSAVGNGRTRGICSVARPASKTSLTISR